MQIAEEIEFLGADLISDCNHDAIFVNTVSLNKYFDKVFEITSDILLNPIFSEEELERSKKQRLNNLLFYRDHGSYLASKLFLNNVHKSSKYGVKPIGNSDSIHKLTRDDIKKFYEKYFHPGNILVAFTGDISYDEAVKISEEKFSGWKYKEIDKMTLSSENTEHKIRIKLIDKKESVQSDIYLGHISVPLNNPDYILMVLLNTIFGGTFTSRLNSKLREKDGFTYGISSSFNLKKYSGEFVIKTSVKNDLTAHSIKSVIEEIHDITTNLVSDEELQNAKNYIQGTFPLQLETSSSVASALLRIKFFELDKDFYNTFISKMNKINIQQIYDTAKKYMHPDDIFIAIAGNSRMIKKELEQIGTVSVLNKLDI